MMLSKCREEKKRSKKTKTNSKMRAYFCFFPFFSFFLETERGLFFLDMWRNLERVCKRSTHILIDLKYNFKLGQSSPPSTKKRERESKYP